LIAVPDIQTITHTQQDEFLLLACDGVFDVLSHQQASDFVRRELAAYGGDPQPVAQRLAEHALSQGSLDNVTAMIICFSFS